MHRRDAYLQKRFYLHNPYLELNIETADRILNSSSCLSQFEYETVKSNYGWRMHESIEVNKQNILSPTRNFIQKMLFKDVQCAPIGSRTSILKQIIVMLLTFKDYKSSKMDSNFDSVITIPTPLVSKQTRSIHISQEKENVDDRG